MKKKNITIDDLAIMVQKGFEETAKKVDVDNLSKSVDKRFERIEKLILSDYKMRIEKLEGEMRELRESLAL